MTHVHSGYRHTLEWQRRRPLISDWVWIASGSLCAGLMLTDLISGRLV